jgi:hypothetical protein
MPATVTPSRIQVRSNLDQLADAFELEVVGAGLFVEAAPGRTVNIALGFEDELGQPVYVTVLEGAVIDEYHLEVQPAGLRTRLSGRDATAVLLDREVQILYQRTPPPTPPDVAEFGIQTPPPLPNEPVEEVAPIEPIEVKVGHWRASTIIEDLLADTGLTLAFQVRDYELLEDFSATGRIKDVIDRLLEPWNLTRPFRVEMTLEGKTLWIRHRDQTFAPPADYTYDVADARLGALAITRRIADKVGHVRLEGKLSQSSLEPPVEGVPEVQGGNIWLAGLKVETRSTEDTYKGSVLVTRIETVATTLYPDEKVTRIVKSTYARKGTESLGLVSRETTENVYEPSVYEEGRVVNNPKLKRTVVTVEQVVKNRALQGGGGTPIFNITKLEEKTNHYNALGFLTGATTVISAQVPNKAVQGGGTLMEPREMRVEKLVQSQPLVYQSETSIYGYSKTDGVWDLRSRSVQDNPGRPPGGPGNVSPASATATGDGAVGFLFEPIFLEDTISEAPDAASVHYSNPNLQAEDLAFILEQLRRASGAWEWEVQLTGATMPWLRRGQRIQFTGLVDADEQEIQVPVLTVTDLSLVHDEGAAPQAVASLTLRGWTEAD